MIRLEDVHVRLGQREVLRGVTASLTERRVGVVGANGSGKSTLARLVNGLVLPSSGTVTVSGLDTRRHAARIRRAVGFLFTDPDAQIVMPTVAEDVAFSLRRKGLTREEVERRVREILERYGLGEHADHPAHHLSGGQKQLLALCRSWCSNRRSWSWTSRPRCSTCATPGRSPRCSGLFRSRWSW